jgi:hypothetical protein
MEKQLTPTESLQLIGETIRNTRKNFSENSYYFLLWGWLMLLASIGHFILVKYVAGTIGYENIGLYISLNWLFFVLMGIVFQTIRVKQTKKAPAKTTIMDKFMKVLWQSSGAGMILIAAVSLLMESYPAPYILVIAGISTLVSGMMINSNSLIAGGIFMGIGAIISTIVPPVYHILVFAAALIGGYIIPGYILRNNNT